MSSKNNTTILMIAATPFFSDRGCHIRIYNEMKYLKQEGIDVVLCTYHLGNDIDGFKIKRIPTIPWYKKITPGASWGKIYLDYLLFKLSWKEYRKNKPTIIHAHLYESLVIACIIKLFSGKRIKIIFDCQGSLAKEMYAYTLHKSILLKPLYYCFMLIEKLLLYIPNKILCSSKNSYDFLTSTYKVPKKKINILNDGVDEDLFTSSSHNTKQIKTHLGIPSENTVILYTGSLSAAKGVQDLFDALPKILQKRMNFTFVFAGYGDLEKEYTEKLQPWIKSKNVLFMGRFYYFDLPRYTAIAHYAIEPKKDSSESSGKLFNYITAGLPIICFKNEFNFNILGDQGIYINTFDDMIKINKMGKRPSIDLSPISWGSIIKKLHRIYE